MSLFVEVHGEYPWSLKDYTDQELRSLLGLQISGCNGLQKMITEPTNFGYDFSLGTSGDYYPVRVWNTDPLVGREAMQDLLGNIPLEDSDDAILAVHRLILHLVLEFKHSGYMTDEPWLSGPKHLTCGGFPVWNLSWIWATYELPNDGVVTSLCRDLLRACNIPTVNGRGIEYGLWESDIGQCGVFKSDGLLFSSVGQVLPFGDYVHHLACPPEFVLLPVAEYLEQAQLAEGVGSVCSDVCQLLKQLTEWMMKRRLLGLLQQYQDVFWWPIICTDFLNNYMDGSLISIVKKPCNGVIVNIQNDPEVAFWLACVVNYYDLFGIDGGEAEPCVW